MCPPAPFCLFSGQKILENHDSLSYDLHGHFSEDDENDFDFIPARDRAK